jgi:hypothetical protein
MSDLDDYLAKHYLSEGQLLESAGMQADELAALLDGGVIPAPSYVVTKDGKVRSFPFGEMAAPGSVPGRYFHPSQLVWIARARNAVGRAAVADAQARLKATFADNFAAALAALNLTTWRLRDSFDEQGAPMVEGLSIRTDSAWRYFLNGTFGLCVANPISEMHIARKEVLQEKLAQLSENGNKTMFTDQQARAMLELIDAYAASAMPFSPVEYPVSSRKRLVEDLRAHIALVHPSTPA